MNQTNKVSFKAFLPVIIIFTIVSALSVLFNDSLLQKGIDGSFLIYGNLLLFSITLVSWIFHRNALNAGNTQVFLRNVYSAMLLKLFVCVISFFIYVSYIGSSQVNKPALFGVMFLYLIYTFVELSILIKYSKRNNNA